MKKKKKRGGVDSFLLKAILMSIFFRVDGLYFTEFLIFWILDSLCYWSKPIPDTILKRAAGKHCFAVFIKNQNILDFFNVFDCVKTKKVKVDGSYAICATIWLSGFQSKLQRKTLCKNFLIFQEIEFSNFPTANLKYFLYFSNIYIRI